jgi:hypothetical protein
MEGVGQPGLNVDGNFGVHGKSPAKTRLRSL